MAPSATARWRRVNHGSHYGFVEQGVVFSSLQPGLATLLVRNDGQVEMTTWQPDDERRWPACAMRGRTAWR